MKMRMALIASALFAATPSEAATYLITYTGVVTTGADLTGIFGTAGADLTGSNFTAVFTLNTSAVGAYSYSESNRSGIFGGTNVIGASPVSGTITINGITHYSSGSSAGRAEQYDGYPNILGPRDLLLHEATESSFNGNIQDHDSLQLSIFSHVNNIVDTAYYASPLEYFSQTGDNTIGSFSFFKYDYGIQKHLALTSATLDSRSVTIAEVGAVPEPTTWATMLLGFGLIGGAMRARRRNAVPLMSIKRAA